ncbi:hypothetical protein [Arthrobacter sp. JSM 101049]|uniref:hypothetical protein n=1 Tax=Arthrobacter sp. JSM 101049 TaxID=929097 RepID=UPI003564D43F
MDPNAPDDEARRETDAEDRSHPDDVDKEAVLDEEPQDSAGSAMPLYSDLVGLESDEADVAEQSLPVPGDEEEHDRD